MSADDSDFVSREDFLTLCDVVAMLANLGFFHELPDDSATAKTRRFQAMRARLVTSGTSEGAEEPE